MSAVAPYSGSERQSVLEVTEEFARRDLAPRALALDARETGALEHAWSGVRALGLDRALLPEHLGGAGLEPGDLSAALERLAAGDAGVALCVLLSNVALASLPEATLPSLADDERWAVAVAPTTRPGERLRARRHAGALEVSGTLPFVLGAQGADGLVVFPGEGGTAFAVRPGTPGVSVERAGSQMGLGAAGAAGVRFERASAQHAAEGRALLYRGVAAIARGVARRAYALALEYARSRRQGGVAIIEHGAVREMLAGMAVRLECCDGVATAGVDGDVPAAERRAIAAKVAESAAAVATTIDAVQVFGGVGYMRDAGVEKLMRDAKYCELYPEPNWILRDRLLDAAPGA